MYGDGPCKPQRILGKAAKFLLIYRTGIGFVGIADILPGFPRHFYRILVIGTLNHNEFIVHFGNYPDLTIKKTSRRFHIVLNEHYLGPQFKLEGLFYGIGCFRKIILNGGLVFKNPGG